MGYIEEQALVVDKANVLHAQVARAIAKAAAAVMYEDPGTANHAKRGQWATRIRKHPDNAVTAAHEWMQIILDNATVASKGNTATDNEVQVAIDAIVNEMAGV